MQRNFTRRHFVVLLSLAWIIGCGDRIAPMPPAEIVSDDGIAKTGNPSIVFSDEVKTNRPDDGTVTDLTFTNPLGARVSVNDYIGEKNLLLVFTRGFSGMICPFCTTQTSRLIANHDEFANRDTQILLVYPGAAEQLAAFQQAAMEASGKTEIPFPILLDQDLSAVKRLGIEAHLAFPSTFLIDKAGNVRLSYVGSTPADRPSIKALLQQINQLDD